MREDKHFFVGLTGTYHMQQKGIKVYLGDLRSSQLAFQTHYIPGKVYSVPKQNRYEDK